MAQSVCILLPTEDRARLTAVIGNRNGSQKQLQRARTIGLSADRLPVVAPPCGELPGEAIHCTGRTVSTAVGISLAPCNASGWRIISSRIARTLETSNDPVFAASPRVPRVTDGLQIRGSLT